MREAMNHDRRAFHAGVRVLLIAVMGLIAALPGTARQAMAALGERYVDPDWGYTIRGPEGWEPRPRMIEGISLVYLGGAYEGFHGNLNVVVFPEPIEVNPQFLEKMVRDLEARMEISADDDSRSAQTGGAGEAHPRGYRVTRGTIAPVAGADAAYIEASFQQTVKGRTKAFRQLQIVIPGFQSHFVLTYTARAEVFEDALPDIRAAVNSFTPPVESVVGTPWFGGRVALLALVVLVAGTILAALAARRRRRGSHIP